MPEEASEVSSVAQLQASLFAERLRLTRDVVISGGGYALSSIAGMVLVPVLLHGLDAELYGIWIAATALQYALAFLNGGLGRGVAREVAASHSASDEDSILFVKAAGVIYLFIATAGMAFIAYFGLPLASALRVSGSHLHTAQLVFVMVGIAFFGDQVQSFAAEVLTGFRRFPAINVIMIISVMVRAAGIIFLIVSGHSLITVAAWHAAMSVITGLATATLAMHVGPQYRPSVRGLEWRRIRRHAQFSLSSQATSAGATMLWRSAPFIVGLTRGSAAIVPYEVGQKFPMFLSALLWQASDVMFPAASEYHRAQRDEHTRQLLVVGTRGILLLVLPAALILWMLAPPLFAAWVGTRFPEAVAILRFTVIAVVADCVAAISVQMLWGQGRLVSVLRLTMLAVVISIAVGWPMLLFVGLVGAAAGLALGVFVAAVGYLVLATRLCHGTVRQLLTPALADLWRPSLLCIASVLLIARLHAPNSWLSLTMTAAAALVVYCTSFYFLDSQAEEKAILREIMSKGVRSLQRTSRKLFRTSR